jgi:hypothetical protein
MKRKKLKPLVPNRNNIETYAPIFTGFYGSHWDEPDFYGEAEYFGLPENFPFWDYFNWGDYKEALSKAFCDKIEHYMSDFIERIDYESLSSPKYYNFTNDSINCTIRPKKKAIQEYIYANKPAFEKYLEDHLKSRDGFISSHSYSFYDWEEDTKKFLHFDKKHDYQGFNLGFVLDFIAENEEITSEIFYDVEVYISEFFTEEFYKFADIMRDLKEGELDFVKMDTLKEMCDKHISDLPELAKQTEEVSNFVKENYIKSDLMNLVFDKFAEEYNILNLEVIIRHITQEIEKKTLEIEFPVKKKK